MERFGANPETVEMTARFTCHVTARDARTLDIAENVAEAHVSEDLQKIGIDSPIVKCVNSTEYPNFYEVEVRVL